MTREQELMERMVLESYAPVRTNIDIVKSFDNKNRFNHHMRHFGEYFGFTYDVVRTNQFVNSIRPGGIVEQHKTYIATIVLSISVVMQFIYEIQSIMRDGNHDSLSRIDNRMTTYITQLEYGMNHAFNDGEEYLKDMQYKGTTLCERARVSFKNSVLKLCKSQREEEHEIVALCTCVEILINKIKEISDKELERFKAQNMRESVSSVNLEIFSHLDKIYKSTTNILDVVDPNVEYQVVNNGSVKRTFIDLMSKMLDKEILLKSLIYARNESQNS